MSDKAILLEKLGRARLDFQSANIKKSGRNNHIGFEYYELHDILPKINELANQYRFVCMVSFDIEKATLKIVDIDDQKQTLEFASPMAGVSLKGAHDIQNMGAVQTYMRRYLYMMAFEIVECDTYDGSQGKENKTPPASAPKNGQQPKRQGKPPSDKYVEGKALVARIGEIMKTLAPNGDPYFSDADKAHAKEIIGTNDLGKVGDYLAILEKELAKFQASPDDHFKDDVPF